MASVISRRLDVLAQVGGGAGAHGLEDRLAVGLDREHHDPGGQIVADDRAEDLGSAEVGQAHVQHRYVRLELARLPSASRPSTAMPDQLEFRPVLDGAGQPLEVDGVILRHDHPDAPISRH